MMLMGKTPNAFPMLKCISHKRDLLREGLTIWIDIITPARFIEEGNASVPQRVRRNECAHLRISEDFFLVEAHQQVNGYDPIHG